MKSLPQSVHLIAVGGSVMHNLALALHNSGVKVTGSDDDIYEPALGRLSAAGISPKENGWFTDRITTDLDAIILGMHAKEDNPELLKAKELNIPVYSFPEFIYEYSKNKQRIVIAGSHGKTTITSMILHVLKECNKPCDYLVGAIIDGFDTMVQLSDAPLLIVEGDEYLNSALDRVPKFFKYHHHIALISGIAWDHVNVFPTFEGYVEQFKNLAFSTPKSGSVIANVEDPIVNDILKMTPTEGDVLKFEYATHPHEIKDGKPYLVFEKKHIPVQFFGKHNFNNVSAAKMVCSRVRITDEQFYKAIQSFKGASKRLELVAENKSSVIYKDFAHSPSKVTASTLAMRELYPKRKLTACLELHTFSSTRKEFLNEYKGALDTADTAIVFINPKVFETKGVTPFTEEEIRNHFNRNDIKLITTKEELESELKATALEGNLLLMSSANFNNLDFSALASDLLN